MWKSCLQILFLQELHFVLQLQILGCAFQDPGGITGTWGHGLHPPFKSLTSNYLFLPPQTPAPFHTCFLNPPHTPPSSCGSLEQTFCFESSSALVSEFVPPSGRRQEKGSHQRNIRPKSLKATEFNLLKAEIPSTISLINRHSECF